jgi:hypothetical protein
MTIEGVVVRTANQQKKMSRELLQALTNACKSNKGLPIIYQYLHNPKEELIVDSDNTMGYVRNVHRNHKGDIIADVEIMQLLRISSNWQGVIDNIAASPKPNQNNIITVDAFIVYDAEAKSEIDKRNEEKRLADPLEGRLAKPGVVPFMSSGNDDTNIKEISEKLIDDYKKRVAQQ